MKESTATLTIELSVICPYCNHNNDLINSEYEGEYINKALEVNGLRNTFVDCHKCGKTFKIDSMDCY